MGPQDWALGVGRQLRAVVLLALESVNRPAAVTAGSRATRKLVVSVDDRKNPVDRVGLEDEVDGPIQRLAVAAVRDPLAVRGR